MEKMPLSIGQICRILRVCTHLGPFVSEFLAKSEYARVNTHFQQQLIYIFKTASKVVDADIVAVADGRVIRKSDLKRETRWNTYVITGLPATPICNPSLESIEAALNPATTENLYFVSDGEGGLRFARTLDAHNRNVRLYRKSQRAADGN